MVFAGNRVGATVCRLARSGRWDNRIPCTGGSRMIVRIDLEREADAFGYRVSYDAEELYADDELPSIVECLIAAVEGMPPEALAAEVWFDGVVSGTYPVEVIGMNVEQVAQHAVNTTAMIDELMPDR